MQRRIFLAAMAAMPVLSRGAEKQACVLGVIEYGQSNAEGQALDGAAVLRRDYPAGLRMPRTASHNVWLGQATVGGRSFAADAVTGLMPLQGAMGSATHGSTAGESMVLRLAQAAPQEIVLFNAAEGGQAIRHLARDASAQFFGFRNVERTVSAIHQQLQNEHKDYVVRIIIMAQGESDAALAQLGAWQEQVRAELESAIQAITAQQEPVWLLSCQPSSFQQHAQGVCSILTRHAQGGRYVCLGPTYNFPFARDFLHHTSIGHDMRGELYAVAYQSLLRTGRWQVLSAIDAQVVQPDRILVRLSEAAAVEQVLAHAPLAQLGIALEGGDIAQVALDGTALSITTRGAAAKVTAVRIGLEGHGAQRTQASIPRTSVRSVLHYGYYRDGTPIYKWLCHQYLPLQHAS